MRAIPLLLVLAVAVTLAREAPEAAASTHVTPNTDGAGDALRIWIYVGPLQPAEGAAAQAVADELLQTAGVAIDWRLCGPTDGCSRRSVWTTSD